MLRLTIQVNAPLEQVIGIKEHLAMELERFGDTRVIEVQEVNPVEQIMMR